MKINTKQIVVKFTENQNDKSLLKLNHFTSMKHGYCVIRYMKYDKQKSLTNGYQDIMFYV